MIDSHRTLRTTAFGLAFVAAAAGFAACGGSSKTNTRTQQPATPAGQSSQSPAPTSPPTTKAPSSGGASF
jgi:hypothetical protein